MKRKPDKVMSLLIDIAKNAKDCGDVFGGFNFGSISDLKAFSEKIKEYETKGDHLLNEITMELNHAFITAIDQEDILLLAEKLDDVIDEIEEVAAYFYMYRTTEIDEIIEEFIRDIVSCTSEINLAIEMLATKQLKEIKQHTKVVKNIEEACDMTERKAIRKLFKKYTDPILLIQYKDLYEMLESTVDACHAVAQALDIITMKNV